MRLLPALLLLPLACAAPTDSPDAGSGSPDAGSGSPDAGGALDAGTPDGGGASCGGATLDSFGACRIGSLEAPVECCAPYDCDDSRVTCERVPPACDPDERGTVVGTCWGPCVPVGLCAAAGSGESLCRDTGGTWLPHTCGSWFCGEPPACDAVIPGCHCGPGKVFDPVAGCSKSDACLAGLGESCGGRTVSPKTCGPGMLCDLGEGGAFDLPGTCEVDPEYACGEGAPCGRGLLCCYPCGIPGCEHRCEPPGPDGDCRARP